MKLRYELKDMFNPTWRGHRFTALERALKARDEAVGDPGRWQVWDRAEKSIVTD
jgi:hypothetical protein